MEILLEFGKWLITNYESVVTAIVAVIMGVIGIATLIPGPEPERTLQKIVDFLRGISRKPNPPEKKP